MGKENNEGEISISKIYHRDAPQIALKCDYDLTLIEQIKQLPHRRYSSTLKLWYLPYTKESYQDLKTSGINYTIINESIDTRQTALSSDTIDIESRKDSKQLSEDENDSGNHPSDISNALHVQLLKNIIYNSGYLIIDIRYDSKEVLFLKTLKSAYWNEIEKKWICKASKSNQALLQDRYQYWTVDAYQKIASLIQLASVEKKAILRMSNDKDKMELKFKGQHGIPNWLKTVESRGYNPKSKIWTMPHNTAIKTRLIDRLTRSGYDIEDYTTLSNPKVQNTRDWSVKKIHILSKVPEAAKPKVEILLDILIRERYSYNTITSYVKAVTRFLHYMEDQKIVEIDSESIGKYLSNIANSSVSNASINLHQSAIRLYMRKVFPEKKISFEELKRPRKITALPKVMSKRQVRKLLSSVNNLKHLSMLYLAYGAGLRSGEICNLKLSNIDWDKNQIWIRKGKGNKDRIVMMSVVIRKILIEYLKEYEPQTNWLFEGHKKGQAYNSSSLGKVFKRALTLAKLPDNYVLHSLRHSFATHLMDTGTDVRLIKDLLGHKDIKTTLIYTHVSNDALLRITSPLDDLGLDKLDKKGGFV